MIWSPIELTHLLGHLGKEGDMWGRGSFGQHIIMLILSNKPTSANLLILVADAGAPLHVRQRAFMIGLIHGVFPGRPRTSRQISRRGG
jgi:hypothetical protein